MRKRPRGHARSLRRLLPRLCAATISLPSSCILLKMAAISLSAGEQADPSCTEPVDPNEEVRLRYFLDLCAACLADPKSITVAAPSLHAVQHLRRRRGGGDVHPRWRQRSGRGGVRAVARVQPSGRLPRRCTPHDHCWHLSCILPRVPATIVRTGRTRVHLGRWLARHAARPAGCGGGRAVRRQAV